MMRRPFFFYGFCLLCLALCGLSAHAANPKAKKSSKVVSSEAGLKIPEWNLVIDAFYLPDLDQMIPGYRVLNVVVENSRSEPIALDALKDKWYIVDHLGKKRKAYNHIKLFDKKLWDRMSTQAKTKLDYPNMIPPGKMVAIDLFFKNDVEIHDFHAVEWDSQNLKKTFQVIAESEDNIEVKYDTTKVIEMPQNPDAVEKNKTEEDYIEARDKYLQDEVDPDKKVYYITPDGGVVETTEGALPHNETSPPAPGI